MDPLSQTFYGINFLVRLPLTKIDKVYDSIYLLIQSIHLK